MAATVAPAGAGRARGRPWRRRARPWSRSPRPRGSFTGGGQRSAQLAAGADAELGEDLAQVPFDGARAEEQLGADLRVGPAVPGQPGDVGLLRGERCRASRRCACAPSRRWPPARAGPARRTPPCRSRPASRARSAAVRGRPRAGSRGAAIRRTAGGRGPAPGGAGCGRAGRSPRDTGPRPPPVAQQRTRARLDAPARSRCRRPGSFSASRSRASARHGRVPGRARRPRPARAAPTSRRTARACPRWPARPPPAPPA